MLWSTVRVCRRQRNLIDCLPSHIRHGRAGGARPRPATSDPRSGVSRPDAGTAAGDPGSSAAPAPSRRPAARRPTRPQAGADGGELPRAGVRERLPRRAGPGRRRSGPDFSPPASAIRVFDRIRIAEGAGRTRGVRPIPCRPDVRPGPLASAGPRPGRPPQWESPSTPVTRASAGIRPRGCGRRLYGCRRGDRKPLRPVEERGSRAPSPMTALSTRRRPYAAVSGRARHDSPHRRPPLVRRLGTPPVRPA